MLLTKEKTNYLIAPEEIISYVNSDRICKIGHLMPSLVFSIIIGVKILPEYWDYYAAEFDKNGIVISFAVFLIFIPVAIINGIVIEKILDRLNSEYLAFKNALEETEE